MIGINKFFNKTRNNELRLETFGMSEVGRRKTTNEDAFLVSEVNGSGKLLAVADGFSHSFGEESSRLAVNAMRESLQFTSNWGILERLQKAVEVSSRKIMTHFQNIHHSEGVGTTLTAVYVVENTAYIAHVGNSRAYLVRGGEVKQLTTDHTFGQVLLSAGVEPSAGARKTLLQVLGVECKLEPLVIETELLPDDYLLVCSDGFSNKMDAAEIIRAIRENADVAVAAERLIEAANERDGSDNITLILARACRVATASRDFPAFWTSRPQHQIAA